MGVRDDLEKVALLDAKIYSHIEELERLRHIALGYRSVVDISNVKAASSPKSPQEKVTPLIIFETNKLEETLQELKKIRQKTFEKVMGLNDGYSVMILFMRYFQRKSWKEIGETLNKKRSQMFNIHDEAIEKLEKN